MDVVLVVFLFVAIACNGVSKLLDRYVGRDNSPFAFSWFTQILSAMLFLPFAWKYLHVPVEKEWLALFVGGALWTVAALVLYIAIKKTEVSLKEPLAQSKIIWALIFGLIFLHESLNLQKLIGTLIVFIGMSLVLFHPERRFGRLNESGVVWVLCTALLSAIIAVVDKWSVGIVAPEMYGFFRYAIPGVVLSVALPWRLKSVKHLLQTKTIPVLLTVLFSTASYFSVLQVYTRIELTKVYPLLQLATVFAVLGGIFVLGEKEHKCQKIIATGVVIIGAIIVKLA